MPKKLTEHVPQVNWRNRRIVITIVGCGGTGSQIATGMPYLHQALLASGHPYGLRVFLIDGDRITETNCVRQPFSRSEVGLYKAVVLINRLNMFWGLDWEAVPHFVRCGQDVPDSDFVISCVDTRAARAVIARVVSLKSRRFLYLLDTGNLADRGQFVLGQPLRKDRKDRAKRLPCAHELFPSIVHAQADKTGPDAGVQRRGGDSDARAVHQQHHRQSRIGAAGSAIPAWAHRISRRVRESGDRACDAVGGGSGHMVAITSSGRKGTSISEP